MKHNDVKFLAMLLAVFLAVPSVASAQDAEEAVETVKESVMEEPMEEPMEMESEEKASPFEFSGWLDQSLNIDQSAAGAAKAVYGMFEIGLRMGHTINENYGSFIQMNGRWDQTLTGNAENNAFSIAAREAYAYWQNDSESARIQIGKYYVPIGWELADPPDLYQYSNSNQFGFFLPTEAVGAVGYFTLSDMIDLALYVSGGFDDDFAYQAGFEHLPSFGERLGLTFGDANVGLSLVVADGDRNDSYNNILVDVDASWVSGDTTVAGEFSLANDTSADVMDYGVMAMVSQVFTDMVLITARVDMLTGDSFADPEVGITLSPIFTMADGWYVVTEVREDLNDQAAGGDHNLTAAFEILYTF